MKAMVPMVRKGENCNLVAEQIHGDVVFVTARIRLCNSSGSSLIVRTLLDSGSLLNLIAEHIAQHLRLSRTKRNNDKNTSTLLHN